MAWIGAITGSLALLLEGYKWFRSGPRLLVRANPNMKLMPPDPHYPADQLYLTIWVSNAGDRNTTLTTIGFTYYKSKWKACLSKFRTVLPDKTWVANFSDLPRQLDIGTEYCRSLPHGEPVEIGKKGGVLYCDAYHALSKKPARKHIYFGGS